MVKHLGQGFDFTQAVKEFAPYLDEAHPDYNAECEDSALIWLTMPQFPAYIAHAFADPNLWAELAEYIPDAQNQKRASTTASDMKLYKTFASAQFPEKDRRTDLSFSLDNATLVFPIKKLPLGRAVRKQEVYPLGYDETELSLDFIHRHVDYEYAIIAIKMCLIDYFRLMQDQIKQKYDFGIAGNHYNSPSSKKGVAAGHRLLMKNLVDFSFLQDFMPLIANTLRQTADDPFAPRTLHRSFAMAFEKQAFQSMSGKRSGYRKCPFAAALTKLMSISVTPDAKDGFTATESVYPGALIASMRDSIRQNFLQALPAQHKAFELNPFYAPQNI